MIENAAAARLFWLLAPYQDVEELRAAGEKALQQKDPPRPPIYFCKR